MKTAFLFPGQGAQHAGMGKDVYEKLPAARELFDRAEAACGLPIKQLCFEGHEDQLARTDIAQPAIFTVSAAMLAGMQGLLTPEQMPQADYVSGLSLGEYTALYTAGAMDFETGVKLVARRGELMQQAAVARPSGMVCILGLDEPRAEELVRATANGQILSCANFNCPGQIVLSGETDACNRAAELAEKFGASGAVLLKVAGAFHSEIMAPAAETFAKTLDEVEFSAPQIRIVSNTDGQVYGSKDEIADRLIKQLVSPVRWQQCMELLLGDNLEKYYEIGPGRVLAGLMRRIDRKTRVTCLNSHNAIEKLAEAC